MKKKILLVSLYAQGYANQLALWYLKAYIIKYIKDETPFAVEAKAFSLNNSENSPEHIADLIRSGKPDILGFSCYVWNIEAILKIASLVRTALPKVKIILGGPEVSARAQELLKKYAYLDVIVRGEGEETFKELIGFYLQNQGRLGLIKGITYFQDYKIIENPPRPEIKDLDSIPSPYINRAADIDFNAEVPLETTRGCIYRCRYCYYHKNYKKVRYFSLSRVEQDLKALLGKGIKTLYVMDATFNADRKRSKQILRIIIRNNRRSSLHLELKAELLDQETVKLLAQAKAKYIEIGVQSTDSKTLKAIGRDFNPKAFKRNIALLNKYKLPYEIQLIDGLPFDSYRGITKSVDWLLGLKAYDIRIMKFSLLPGTYLRAHAEEFKIKFVHRPPYCCLKSNTFSAKDLLKTHKLRLSMFFYIMAGF